MHGFAGGSCAGRQCRLGRVCRRQQHGEETASSSVCVCAEAEDCDAAAAAAESASTRHHRGRGRPVCGSDGRWYRNHCELHRSACLTGRHLRVNRRTAACIGTSAACICRMSGHRLSRLAKEHRQSLGFPWYHWFGVKLFPAVCAQDSRRVP